MTVTLTIAAEKADNIVFAVEAGMERLRKKFSPERPPEACCHTCGGCFTVTMLAYDAEGQPIWLHIGSCLTQFASSRRRAAEARIG